MQIEKLHLKNFRGIYQTEISFSEGLNLIAGVNGVGKTAVLDVLRILISLVLPSMTYAPKYGLGFEATDIMNNRQSMMAELTFRCHHNQYSYTVHKSNEKWIDSGKTEVRSQAIDTPDHHKLAPTPNRAELLKKTPQPICVFFSTRRSWASEDKSKNADGPKGAYYRALAEDRGLRTRDLIDWWKSKEAIAKEAPKGKSARQLQTVLSVLESLLPDFTDWTHDGDRISVKKKVTYDVQGETRTELYTLYISQLSEGERSLIAFAFDLTRRLSQANPDSDNPAGDGTGIVLIDEIDLHLHPEWQRAITHTLTKIFPKIQFITSTHSPQVIGETLPENVILLSSGGTIFPVTESLGRESGWILRHLMNTSERTKPMERGLNEVKSLIAKGDLKAAKEKVAELREAFGSDPSLVAADTTIDRRRLFNK